MCQTLSLEFNPDDFIGRLSAQFLSLAFCSFSPGLLIAFRDALLFNMCNFLLVFYDCSKFIACISPELAFTFQPLHFPLSDIVASLKKMPCESVLDKSIVWGRCLNFDSERHLPWTLWLGVFTVFCDFPLYNVTFTLFMCLLSVQLFLNPLLRGNVNFRRVGSVCSPQCLPSCPECRRRLDILNKRVGFHKRGKLFYPRQHFAGSHTIICYVFWREMKHFEAHRFINVAKNGCGAEAFSVLCNLVLLSSSVRHSVGAGLFQSCGSLKGDSVAS